MHLLRLEVGSRHEVLVVQTGSSLPHTWVLVLNLEVGQSSSVASVDHLLVQSLVPRFVRALVIIPIIKLSWSHCRPLCVVRDHILLHLSVLLWVQAASSLLVVDKSPKILNLLLLHVVVHHEQLLLLSLPLVHRLLVRCLLLRNFVLLGSEFHSSHVLTWLRHLLLFLALCLHLVCKFNLGLHLLLRLLRHVATLLNNLIGFPYLVNQVLLPRSHLLSVIADIWR